jgi:hypothetical protein
MFLFVLSHMSLPQFDWFYIYSFTRQCSKSCGGGEQYRHLQCVNQMTQQSTEGCPLESKPNTQQKCHEEPCPDQQEGNYPQGRGCQLLEFCIFLGYSFKFVWNSNGAYIRFLFPDISVEYHYYYHINIYCLNKTHLVKFDSRVCSNCTH